MAGIITISPGHDASYPWRQIGTSPDPSATSEHALVGPGVAYYLSPAEKGGEPPGRWRGDGLPELGFRDGQIIDRETFECLYGHFLDPRDPDGQTRLGRRPQQFRSADDIYAALAALEPEATAERRAELLIEARTQVRLPVQYFDVTFSVSKSISLLHASAMANAAQAEAAGNPAETAYWRQAAADIWASIEAGNQAALDYLQREAGYTRSGYHGRKVNGVTTGRWEDAHRFIIGSFPQHTSRDGDPQLHIHNLVLNRVQRERDGAWRTLDSKALYEHRGAASAIAALVMESSLSREFGVGWVQRPDGHGREIRGVGQALMEEFSSRRQSITALTARFAAEFKAQHGFAPDARALGKLRQWANHASRARKPAEPLDLTAEVRRWAAQARASESGALEPVLPAVSSRRGAGALAEHEPRAIFELTSEQEREVMTLALATVQESQPAWRKADLIRCLGELLPDDTICRDSQSAAALLQDLAERAIAGGAGEQVLTLTAPEWPVAPSALRRADGRSIYQPHGATQYATVAQLNLEEQVLAQAQQHGAPSLAVEEAARLLGADQAQLKAQLSAESQDPDAAQQMTGSGLRLYQAAAAFAVLTTDRRAEILVGPAGSGKTHTAATIARLWQQAAIGEVHGLTVSQAARNVLHEAGVGTASNLAEFLGHLKGQREARGTKPVGQRTLLILDEASTIPVADLAAVLRTAAARDCRVLLTGDHEQLAAVNGGGAMTMLARAAGFTQLVEPVRFDQDWERDATLRLRAGDTSVLAQYDEHGRLRGGTPEQVADQACRAYVADHLAGKDTLLLARTSEQARELSRRVRDDLIRYGLVNPCDVIGLRHRATAGVGDLIMARANDRKITAGQPDRPLANRDILRIEAADKGGVAVRRLTGRNPGTGQPTWSDLFRLSRTFVFSHCDLAYATTVHTAQGRTVQIAHALVDGLGHRQWLYVAMSRGRRSNYAYCVTGYPRLADPQPGSRPAPELARARLLAQEAAGLRPTPGQATEQDPDAGNDQHHRDPQAVLADIVQRDGAVLSATETLRTELANADHLATLAGIRYDITRQAQASRYATELRDTLPEPLAADALADPASTWLWRSLRQAEEAGLNSAQVLRDAAAARSLTDARNVARVLDSRIRRQIDCHPPAVPRSWADQIPSTGDPDLDRFMTDLAHAMDDRTRRIGEHITQTQPAWAVRALGLAPGDSAERAAWQQRAATIGAYREIYGYDSQTDAIGPKPPLTAPEAWARWHAALAALDHIDGIDLRGLSDGQLTLRRATYQRELAWAPPYVAEDLRLARLQARTAWENATRAKHAARAAAAPEAAARHRDLARTWDALHAKATTIATTLADAHETRRQWAALTDPTMRMALAADLELRRRHPDAKLPALNPPTPAIEAERIASDSPGSQNLIDLSTAEVPSETEQRLKTITDTARRAQLQIDYLASLPRYAADDHTIYLGTAWDVLARRQRDAIIQPAKPEIKPAVAVLRASQQRTPDLEPEIEAG